MKLLILLIFILSLIPFLAYSESDNPQYPTIRFKGSKIVIKPSSEIKKILDQKTYKEDVTGDGELNYVVGIDYYEQGNIPNGMVLIGEKKNDELKVLHKIDIHDHFDNIDFSDANKDGIKDLLIWGVGGMHHTNLWVVAWQNGDFITLFQKGSAAGVNVVKDNQGLLEIWVGRANWEDPNWCYATGERLWEIHTWDGEKFVYNETRSTSPLKTELEEVKGYVEAVLKRVDKGANTDEEDKE